MTKPFNLDTIIHTGQKVVIKRSVTFVYELDVQEYMDEEGFEAISVEWLNKDIYHNTDIRDVLDEYDVEVESDIVEVFDIK